MQNRATVGADLRAEPVAAAPWLEAERLEKS
jgi:hypothetical protein